MLKFRNRTKGQIRKGSIQVMIVLFAILAATAVSARVDLSFEPVEAFTVYPAHYPTGAGWSDIDQNGWLDLVLGNGIDVTFSPNMVYFNHDGRLDDAAGWISEDAMPTGNICVGDINNDGYPDLAVSNLGQSPSFTRLPQGYYINNGEDGFSEINLLTPDANSFSCAMGDPDGDGDLDLVFAEGNHASNTMLTSKLYFNNGGVIDSVPGWETDDRYFGVDVAFVDIDLDGDLDLGLGGRNMGVAVYYNNNGVLETSPSWHSFSIIGGRQIAFGDVDGDGYPDLAAAGIGQGYFVFKNYGGTLEMTPSWSCPHYPEPSAVAWADADGDGDLDLAGGGWNSHLGVFENVDGTLGDSYAWKFGHDGSDGDYNLQQLAWGDFDEDGLIDTSESFAGDSSRKLFYLSHKPIHEIYCITIDGEPLALSQYCHDPAEGWISLATPPLSGETLNIEYAYSNDLDLVANTTARVLIFENYGDFVDPLENAEILLLMGQHYGANICIEDGSTNILDNFERHGWNLTITGNQSSIQPCSYFAGIGGATIDVDYLVSDITDVSTYDALVILPCSDSYESEITDPDVLDLVGNAVDSGLVVAAWCPGTRVLAAADVISGKNVTGKADFSDEYTAAGATFTGITPPVTDGNIVTIVRGNFYRNEGCRAIYDALYLHSYPVFDIDSAYFVDDNGDGFYDSGERARFYFYLENAGVGVSDVIVSMTCNNPDVSFITPSITVPYAEGNGAVVDNLSLPIEYIVPEVEAARYDSFFVTIETEYGKFGEVYAFEQESGRAAVLVVDDDRGADYENIYYDDLHALDIPCHLWDKNSKGAPDYETLGEYHLVCWFTGDSAADYLQAEDIAAMRDYLDGGGNLFLTGQGLASELHQEDSAFLTDYLHCTYYGPSTFSTTRLGVSGGVVGDDLDIKLGGGSDQAESLAQAITASGGAQYEFSFYINSSHKCGVSYSGTHRSIFFTFGYESISNNYSGYATRDTVLSRILSFSPEFTCGDADNSTIVNLLDIIYIINYLYRDGPAPDSPGSADVNGDGSLNILDATYLINYLYKGGPEPDCP